MLTEYRTLQQEPLEQKLSIMSGVDASGMPVDSGGDVNRIFEMLANDHNKLNHFEALLNIQPEKDRNQLLLDAHTFRRIEKFTGEAGTWQEWSFGSSMTASAVDNWLGVALYEVKNKASTPLTNLMFHESNLMSWSNWFPQIGQKYTQALFNILVALTSVEANAVVRNVTSKTENW